MSDTTWLIMAAILTVVAVLVTMLIVSVSQRQNVNRLRTTEEELEEVAGQTESLRIRLGRQNEQKHQAYYERNMLVTLLFHIVKTEKLEGWVVKRGYTPEFTGWEHCIYVQAPAKFSLPQLSWHYKTGDDWMLDTLRLPNDGEWDGTTTEEKYKALTEFFKSAALSGRLAVAPGKLEAEPRGLPDDTLPTDKEADLIEVVDAAPVPPVDPRSQ